MVRHEAVRRNCKATGLTEMQQLIPGAGRSIGVMERGMSAVGARGQEVRVGADVGEAGQAGRSAMHGAVGKHAVCQADPPGFAWRRIFRRG